MAQPRHKILSSVVTSMIVVSGCLMADAIDPNRVENPDKQINIFLLGRAGAGKSSVSNIFVENLLSWASKDFTLDTPQEWTREGGPDAEWEQCDCTECQRECPMFNVSASTSSCTSEVLASAVVWAQLSKAHTYADELPSSLEADHEVFRIQIFDTPGMPDTDLDRMAEYYNKIVHHMAQVGRVDALVWVQSDGRVNAADRGLRVLLRQFHIFPTKVLLVNGKGHYRRSGTVADAKRARKKDTGQPEKEEYRNRLLADWTVENEVGVGWHGQMFVSVDLEDLQETVIPKVISFILALSADRRANHDADPKKLKTLHNLWQELTTEFSEFTSSQEFRDSLYRDARRRLSQIELEVKFLEGFEAGASLAGNSVRQRLGLFGGHLANFGAWLFQNTFKRAKQLRAAKAHLQMVLRHLENGSLEGIEYIKERAGEIRDLCALLAKPDCPDVGGFVRDPLACEGLDQECLAITN